MSRIGSEVWTRLEGGRPAGDRLAARLAVPEVTERLLCALDSQGKRHLLIVLQSHDEELRDSHSRGLTVTTRELVIGGNEPARYLDLECRDPVGNPALDLIGSDLARELARAAMQPAEITRRVLARWRRFWGQVPRSMLSREQQIGLFGELWFAALWLAAHTTIGAAVKKWRGPFGARHDFEWSGTSVEVKVTTVTRALVHRINGIDQLVPPENGRLFLFSIRVREEGGASNSLPALIQRIRGELETDDEALNQFETALIQVGYSPLHEHEYAKLLLRVVEQRLFTVVEGFPRITSASFTSGPPAAIERLEYDVNLSAQDAFCVAREPLHAGPYIG
jgi:hypothetical protein